ncbi:MAG: hypothetical protein II252_06690 [Clostridia bacterium]|nr:hypothetical protein [Clostridia bacterium]
MNNKEKKDYLSLYMLQNAKINRLNEMSVLNPCEKDRYTAEIEKSKSLRQEIEEKIEAVDGGVLSELLYCKYICGKPLIEVSYHINYSLRQTERLHIKALNKLKI